jgi:uncharacterized protein (TIGR03089 family)
MTTSAPHSGSLPARLDAELARDPGRPRLTWYESGGSARVELSGSSVRIAVAKTAALLAEEFGLDPGDRVELHLPPHWQLAVWLLGAWSAGTTAVLVPDAAARPPEHPADVLVLGPQHLSETAAEAVTRSAAEIVALSLDAFGGPLREPLPPHVVDHAVAARSQPDQFVALPMPGDAVALVDATGRAWTADDLMSLASATAPPRGWADGDRVLHTGALRTGSDVVAALLAPWLAGASVVWWWNPPGDSFVASVTAEQVNVVTRATAGLPTAMQVLAGAPVSS